MEPFFFFIVILLYSVVKEIKILLIVDQFDMEVQYF